MKNHSVKLWSFLSVVLFASILVGCDTEPLEYEDDGTYALFDRPAMAPTPEELSRALRTIAANYPMGDVPWAYSIILDFLGVVVDPDQISSAKFTVQEIGAMLENVGVELADWLPQAQFVSEVLRKAVTEFNTPGFNPDSPQNAALAALASSLENRGVTSPGQINDNTQLTHGDLLILLVCIHQSTTADPGDNTLIDAVDEVLEDNNIVLSPTDLPPLKQFIEETIGTPVDVPHQGSLGV